MNKRPRPLASALSALSALFIAAAMACGGSGGGSSSGGDPEIAVVRLSAATMEFVVGDAERPLAATVEPPNAAGGDALAWSVDPPTGVVTLTPGTGAALSVAGVAPIAPGGAVITVAAPNGVKATCAVTVTAAENVPVAGVTLGQASMSLGPDDTGTLTATVQPADATNKNVTWTVAPTGVVNVAPDGLNATVTAVAPGQAIIKVTTEDGGHDAFCAVTVASVSVPVTGVTVLPTTLSLTPNGTGSLTATVLPAEATNKNVTWTVAPPTGVVNIAPNGPNGLSAVVTGVAPGNATITVASAADPTKKADCMVTVSPANVPVTGVEIAPAALSLPIGGTAGLTAAIAPLDATDREVEWSSHDSGIAEVTGDGLSATVTAVGTGTTTIVVVTNDGGKSSTCQVTVTEPVTHIYVAGEISYAGSNRAMLWTDGVAEQLSSANSGAKSVSVKGDYVYVAGYEGAYGGNERATLWTNGIPQQLSSIESYALSVFVTDEYVYVAGYEIDAGVWRATTWRNGIVRHLNETDQWSQAKSIFVLDGTVYVAGWESVNYQAYATVWTNVTPQHVDTSNGGEASAVYASGGHVYAGGNTGASDGVHATVWKDGTAQTLSDHPYSLVNSIFVVGDTVYAGGAAEQGAAIWTNGNVQHLGDDSLSGVYSVYVSGGVVYAAGYSGNPNRAMLWTNGAPLPLHTDNGQSWAHSVFVDVK
jgi:uncharacterized protein YjdB